MLFEWWGEKNVAIHHRRIWNVVGKYPVKWEYKIHKQKKEEGRDCWERLCQLTRPSSLRFAFINTTRVAALFSSCHRPLYTSYFTSLWNVEFSRTISFLLLFLSRVSNESHLFQKSFLVWLRNAAAIRQSCGYDFHPSIASIFKMKDQRTRVKKKKKHFKTSSDV